MDLLPVSSGFYEVPGSELGQVLRQGRLPQPDLLPQFGHIHLAIQQVAQDQQTLGISHGGKEARGLLSTGLHLFDFQLAHIRMFLYTVMRNVNIL